MKFRTILVGIFLLMLPLKGWALPVLESDPMEADLAPTEIVLSVTGFSPGEGVGGVTVQIPTDNPGYSVLDGSITNFTALDQGTFEAIAAPTAIFRGDPQNDLFMSVFILSAAFQPKDDFEFGRVTIEGLEPDVDVALLVGSTITVELASGEILGNPLGGQVIATVVPEPGTLVLLGAALAGLSLLGRRPKEQ